MFVYICIYIWGVIYLSQWLNDLFNGCWLVEHLRRATVESEKKWCLTVELFTTNSIVYEKVRRDRSMYPLSLWNWNEIRRFIKWIAKKKGHGHKQVFIIEPAQLSTKLKYNVKKTNILKCEYSIRFVCSVTWNKIKYKRMRLCRLRSA